MTGGQWLDFNKALDNSETTPANSVSEIKRQLLDRLPHVLAHLFPNGIIRGQQFFIGDVEGNTGKSLVIELAGEKAGMWIDFSTGESGDILDLWARVNRRDIRTDFAEIIQSVELWLGNANTQPVVKASPSQAPIDDLGPRTGKWDYTDAEGNLIACVYRYDPPGGKEFRPWDVKARKAQAPTPRPLYNQVGIAQASHVVLVEGEKSADALIQSGVVATTAMNGANAPVDKTDWLPLQNKHVVIWPDNDEPGREYAQNASAAIANAGALSVAILSIPVDKPEKWDAYDAVVDGINPTDFIAQCYQPFKPPSLEAFSLGELLDDDSPIPDDLIEPRVLTPGGMVVFGGAAKVGKSDFLLSWLTHMAAGEPFLGLKPTRRLRTFYLQAEVQYHYLRERLQSMNLPEVMLWRASENLFITPQLRLILNDEGMALVIDALKKVSEAEPLDVIVIDPLRNLFDGGEEGASENDNQAMLYFLRERVEKLRDAINPDAGIIIVHHTKKINKKQLIEDPFLSLSGAGALRGYYTTGMLLYKPEESESARRLTFELRNGPGIPTKTLAKKSGRWTELAHESERLVNQAQGEKLDAERIRKRNVIIQVLYDEAQEGRFYTANQFAEKFEGKHGLGGIRTINERISVGTTKGEIKFFRNPQAYQLPPYGRSRFGYLCTEGMTIKTFKRTYPKTGESLFIEQLVKPTHYKCPQSGQLFEEGNPDIWIYQQGEVDG